MNKILLGFNALLLIGLSIFSYIHFSSEDKIAFVNSAQLLNDYQGMIEARKAYQQKSMTWQANIDTLTSEVQNAIKKYEKESGGMTNKERELSQELLKSKQQQLIDYQKAIRDKAQQEDILMTEGVITQVNSYLEEYGKSHNFKIILAATDAGNIVYAEEALDITADVTEGLNKQYSGI